jgi:1-acyl-sn-glycerol-3-phosphate acyltransferase
VVVRCLISAEGDGVENIPAHGPAIFAANHISLFDMAILGSVISELPRGVVPLPTFIIEERWRWLAHPYASRFGDVIYIRRGEGDAPAIEAARHVLASGGIVAITPEGHATRGALARARPGAGYLASDTGVRVYPLAIFGHDRVIEYWKKFRRAPVRVRLGKSITIPPDGSGNADFQRHSDRMMGAIAALMPHEYHGAYAAREEVETPAAIMQ